MAHNCKTLIIHCMDFRLGKPMKEYLERNNLLGDCDIISVAGGVKSLLTPKNPSDRDFILGQIEISISLHKVQEIILSNHTDCGAYGGSSQFDSFGKECEFHIGEMKRAKELILGKYPDIKIKMALGKIESSGLVVIEKLG